MQDKLIELILSEDFDNCSLASEIMKGLSQDEVWEIVETFTEQKTLFQKIGFSFFEVSRTEIGIVFDFKYYPEYLKDSHYTLVLFYFLQENLNSKYKSDYRLYEHSNEDGRYINSPFQCSYNCSYNYLEDSCIKTFRKELMDLIWVELEEVTDKAELNSVKNLMDNTLNLLAK